MKILITLMLISSSLFGASHWMKIKANSRFQRSLIANLGINIESVYKDHVVAIGDEEDLKIMKNKNLLMQSFILPPSLMDFPSEDEKFHNYEEAVSEMRSIQALNPEIVRIEEIGNSYENRKILNIHLSTDFENHKEKSGVVFLGTHHAREHLSTEIPLMVARYLVEEYNAGNSRIVDLIQNRDIHIVPIVNPDGLEFDISTGDYKMWRKNRRQNYNGTYGVDLNRNYGFGWGTGGSSKSPRSDVYMGEAPFSEPETQAVKSLVESLDNVTVLLSFHTFSELILYPWGHQYESISNQKDFEVHKTMAEKMAQWNGYRPMQSSGLYIASGDTTDWSYGELGIISFTFELDPSSMWSGGFYPGQDVIPQVFRKNLEPVLYLIEKSSNPYSVLNSDSQNLGLKSNMF